MKYNFIYIGANGFPVGLATIQRQLLIAKGLNNDESRCSIICRFGIYNKDTFSLRKGNFESIPFEYASFIAYRHDNFLVRTVNKIFGFINEFWLLFKYRDKSKQNVLIGVRTSFINTLLYRIYSWILFYKYIIDINEAHSLKNNQSQKLRLNHYLFDNYGIYLCDEIIVISEFLKEMISRKRANVEIKSVPVLCDIQRISQITPYKSDRRYILYCASASYLESAIFVINSFKIHQDRIELFLILSGDKNKVDIIKSEILNQRLERSIHIFSNLPYDELIAYYKGADALLIPLPETLDHKARFPHKIGEYAASCRPIITNRWGELTKYFNNESALIAEHFDEQEYSDLIRKVIEEKENDELITNSINIARKNFDYRNVFRILTEV